ncbi:DEAD/DEAH box helicase [Treponema endosymbiont of Eucomonympha sp.]|uniref:DEAD/DEAH box helicase n=1 Tax=Treponema endosymbiont of Eucomonympha sp. TaxID=1580831 RepID=UPI000785A0A3|nr:DEAD/DEAH box helicase family protein [Treponema endosymbiont of Eucomonympha sp.]
MKEIAYQIEYIDEITDTAVKFLNDNRNTPIILKAPTGSGKTYIISQAISKIIKKIRPAEYCFIWISVNSLHGQSKQALSLYLEKERLLTCISIEDIQDNTIAENEIVFINWDSLIKENNIFRTDNERNWNLASVVTNTKEDGREIILIIDESHRTAKTDKAQEVIKEIEPRLIIEMTATPLPKTGHMIEIPLRKVVDQGMIKREILINSNCRNAKENKDLLDIALKKRKDLCRAYKILGKSINPLLLIQIPNKKQTDSSNPEDYITGLLAEFGITEQNGKLALRFSGDAIHEIDAQVKPNDSGVEVLIFKEAIALGWDCPRASILFLQREWKQERYSFNIQTLGRIMRMPEQIHYPEKPELNAGYIFSASDNFEVVQELASDYVSSLQMERDEEINTKPLILLSEFIRRKRELTRLSGAFKKCLFTAASEMQDELNGLNITVHTSYKQIGDEGRIIEIDKSQEVEFARKIRMQKAHEEVVNNYVSFCGKMTTPYARARSTQIIMSALRAWFIKTHTIENEDTIAYIVMYKTNNPVFMRLLENAKERYAQIPPRNEEVVTTDDWEIPPSISIFTDYEKYSRSNKSIIKQSDDRKLYVKRNKNGKIEFSKPEESFIDELESTDDDILWWFKNGAGESKYFGIAYKKLDNHYYGFYPDFLIKTKQETIIVEIKDNKDFKPENVLKLNAGRDYIARANNKEKIRFYILSPLDFSQFFTALKDQKLDSFNSLFEEKLLRYNQSQRKVHENDAPEKDAETQQLYFELAKTISELEDQKLKNELLTMDLTEANRINDEYKTQVITLRSAVNMNKIIQPEGSLKISTPFNICVLGEVTDESQIKKELNNYFEKKGVATNDWDIEFFNNTKLQHTDVLRGLVTGQSKYHLALTGQIYHHSGKGNKKANIISELKQEKYIPHKIACNPKDKLTLDDIIKNIEEYISDIGKNLS